MKITRILLMVLIVMILSSCQSQQAEIGDITLSLIGDETVWIEEGLEYEDLGVLVNNEKADYIGYYSSVNTDRVGTYYVKYVHYDKEVIRTVIVVAGAKTQLLSLIEDLDASTNFSYTLELDVRFTRGDMEFHTFEYEDYDINGSYRYGTRNATSYQMNEYTQNAYIYIDEAYNKEDHYMFDEHSMWYQEKNHYPKPTTSVTDFKLDGVRSVTKEENGEQTIYTTYLNYEDYQYAYNTKINLIPDEFFDFEVDDYIELTITVENNNIVAIETDLTDIMKDAISEASNAIPLDYSYKYTFENFDEVEEIVIPEEGIFAKRLVYPEYQGTGTKEDPFIVMDKAQFITMGNELDQHYKLGADIDLSNSGWMPFGSSQQYTGQPYCFTGSLDGDGYSILNLTASGEYNIESYGLFLCIDGTDGDGIVTNLTFDNVYISLHDTDISFSGGVLASEIINGRISNVSINGSMNIRIQINNGFSLISLGSLAGEISSGTTLSGNSYDVDITLRTNLLETNYFIHEVVGIGQEYLTTYESTSTITVDTTD